MLCAHEGECVFVLKPLNLLACYYVYNPFRPVWVGGWVEGCVNVCVCGAGRRRMDVGWLRRERMKIVTGIIFVPINIVYNHHIIICDTVYLQHTSISNYMLYILSK